MNRWQDALGWLLRVGCAGLASGVAMAAAPLTVLVEPATPFVIERAGPPTGPYVDAFQQLVGAQGLQTTVLAMPMRRALLTAQQKPDTCILALNYAPETTEVMVYLGRVAPMYVWAYARHDAALPIRNLGDLKSYAVGSIDIAEVRQVLGEAGIRYEPLVQMTRGVQMLQAKRFDVLIGDVGPALATDASGVQLDRLFTVTRVERWLACNPHTDRASLAALRQGLREGLFAESVRGIWARYGLEAYFQQIRKEWSATGKP
jgi:hypothetical protein